MKILTANEVDNERRLEVAKRIENLHFNILTTLCTMAENVRATDEFKVEPAATRNSTSFMLGNVEVPISFTAERKGWSGAMRVNGKVTIVVGPFGKNHVFRDRKNGHDLDAIATCIIEWVERSDAEGRRMVEIEKKREERKKKAAWINETFHAVEDAENGNGPYVQVNKFDELELVLPAHMNDDQIMSIMAFIKKEPS